MSNDDDNDDTVSNVLDHYPATGDHSGDGVAAAAAAGKKDNSEVDLEKGLDRGKQMQAFDYDDEKVVVSSSSSPFRFLGEWATRAEKSAGETTRDGNKYEQEKLTSPCPPLMARSLKSLVPRAWADKITSSLDDARRLEAGLSSLSSSSPAKPFVDLVVRLLTTFLSLSVRTLVSRVTMALLLVLFYFVLPLVGTGGSGGGGSGVGSGNALAVGDTVRIAIMAADDDALRAMVEGGGFNMTSLALGTQSGSIVGRA